MFLGLKSKQSSSPYLSLYKTSLYKTSTKSCVAFLFFNLNCFASFSVIKYLINSFNLIDILELGNPKSNKNLKRSRRSLKYVAGCKHVSHFISIISSLLIFIVTNALPTSISIILPSFTITFPDERSPCTN